MKSVKRFIKKLLPNSLLGVLLPAFHTVQSFFYALIFGFPARKLKVIGVTGTNGKTTTVSYIAEILEAAGYKVGASSTTFYKIGDKVVQNKANRTVADPRNVNWLLRKMRWAKVDYVVLEVTSHALAQNRLLGVPFEAAVMTNLTEDHMDYHKTMGNYAAAKAKLFQKDPRFIALNADDEWFEYYDAFPADEQKMTYGTENSAEAQISKAKLTPNATTFTMTLDKTVKIDFKTNMLGQFNVYNAAAAITICYLLHIPKSAIQTGIKELEGVPGRMESIPTTRSYNLLIDFAHTPDGLENVLQTLKHMTSQRLILVFGGIGNRDKERQPMGQVAAKYADRIILTDDEVYDKDPAFLRADVLKGIDKAKGSGKTTEVAGRRNGIKKALEIAKKGDTVVITGMGDQQFTRVGDNYVPWNDKQVVLDLLDELDAKVT